MLCRFYLYSIIKTLARNKHLYFNDLSEASLVFDLYCQSFCAAYSTLISTRSDPFHARQSSCKKNFRTKRFIGLLRQKLSYRKTSNYVLYLICIDIFKRQEPWEKGWATLSILQVRPHVFSLPTKLLWLNVQQNIFFQYTGDDLLKLQLEGQIFFSNW